jgi:hypothetical protein
VKIERSAHNELGARAVHEVFRSRAYQERKCQDSGALDYTVAIVETGGDDGPVVRTMRRLPTAGFPAMLRKFVPSAMTVTETIRWRVERPDGSRTAELSVDFHGAPVTLRGTISIVPDGPAGATVVIDAVFKAHVPLLGGKIEALAAPIVLAVIDAEERTGQAWAAPAR